MSKARGVWVGRSACGEAEERGLEMRERGLDVHRKAVWMNQQRDERED